MTTDSPSPYVPALRFRWLTPAYDRVVRLTTRERVFKSRLVRQLDLKHPARVLDIGCGTGTLALLVKQQHPAAFVAGLDGDPATLAIAQQKARAQLLDIRWVHGLSDALPFPDESFDVVVSSLFFHHLTWQNKLRTAREVHRVLRPGGALHVADWGRPSNGVMRMMFLLVQALDGITNTRDHVTGRLPRLFEDAGFTATSVTAEINTPLGTIVLLRAGKRVIGMP